MKKTDTQHYPQNPADVARESFRQLATRRIAPTPEAYAEIYYEIAGIVVPASPAATVDNTRQTDRANSDSGAVTVLTGFASSLNAFPGEIAQFGQRFNQAAETKNWREYSYLLAQLTDKYFKKPPLAANAVTTTQEYIPDGSQTRLMRELLGRTLTYTISSLLQDAPELSRESEALGAALKIAVTDTDLNTIATRLKQLCYKIEIKTGDISAQQELLFRLFKLLLENISELLDEESWMHGQVAVVQHLIANPLDLRTLEDATRCMKEVIYKQGLLKHSLTEAKVTVKNMMLTFIDRLGIVAASTTTYHEKIGAFSQKISTAGNIKELNYVLDDVLRETSIIQAEALTSRDQMMAARQEVLLAEARITELEAKLKLMSELVREDQLTGSLNRRGLDDVFEREAARADRRGNALCVAMLDLDNFKRLNDTLGHVVGDEALVHLVRVVKETLRTMDVIARFGGEEFLILLPETNIEEATQTLTRVQRALTKHFFMHNNERVLITFSAGVALRAATEDQASVVSRADKALYQAKKAGKNRVVAAE